MKRRLFVLMVVMAVLFTFAMPVGASPKAETKFGGGVGTPGGITFTFYVDENLSAGQLKGSVSWDGGSTPLYCGNPEGNVVTCSVPRSALDKRITVTFNGSSWGTFVKSQPYCYGVWIWADDTGENWVDAGPHCQDEPAQWGDTIPFTLPYPANFNVWDLSPSFMDFDVWSNSGCYNPYVGPAYYENVFVC